MKKSQFSTIIKNLGLEKEFFNFYYKNVTKINIYARNLNDLLLLYLIF